MARRAPNFVDSDDSSLAIYLREIRRTGLLTPAEEVKLARKIHRGDKDALNRLVQANLRFVVAVARTYQGRGLSLADLIEEGNLGLMKAAQRFDEKRGFRFISYAIWWIRQSILQALHDHSRVVRIPVNRAGRASRIDRAAQALEQTLGRPATSSDVAEALGISEEEVREHQSYTQRAVSLDAPASEEGDAPLLQLIANDEASDPDARIAEKDLARDLRDAMRDLDPRERKILTDYFGIETGEGVTLESIGKELGLTRERVRQLKERAIRKLFLRKDREKLRSYLA
ncbi:MAG TPA: RNA polymerase sigma factor RpoD/SigA [Candidatus Eisenbacteria bacterium]|nr:RNA polymerase sigma factor RpoD/SigA [Candidatus Eisenbacteria bacterium]